MTGPDRPPAGAPRVLVVDDDPPIRRLLLDALDLEGYQARAAAEGQEALATIESWRPDLILLDLMMPGMDGWSFLTEQAGRASARDIPVVVVSASRLIETPRWPLEPAALVVKPFDLDELLSLVARLTDGR